MELFDDVQDPSDFPVDTLRKLDSSLRCPICRELFDGPVILHCGHTFCSLCVRTLLPAKPECPQCRAPAKELHIVRNATFEQVVIAWSDARTHTLQLARDSVRSHPSPPPEGFRGAKRKQLDEASGLEAGPSKLPRRESNKGRSAPFEQEEDDDEDRRDVNDEELEPLEQVGSAVACPLCQRDVALDVINQHIDSACKKFATDSVDRSAARREGDSKSKAAWETIFNGQGKKSIGSAGAKGSDIPLKKLAKVSYGTMKLNDLRKLLSDKGLSSTGEKQELIQRYQMWIAIYNANLDRGQPKAVGDLKRQLKEMEDAISRPGTKKVQDDEEYARKNNAQFASLIEKARPKTKAAGESISVPQSLSPNPGSDLTGMATTSCVPSASNFIVID